MLFARWMEHCLKEELPESTELEEGLRNGVYLAKLGHFFSPTAVPLRKIYDKDFKRFEVKGLHFKHTDNINHFYRAMEHIGLPRVSSFTVKLLIKSFNFCFLLTFHFLLKSFFDGLIKLM